MAITSLDLLIAAASQRVAINKTASRTAVANIPFSIFDMAGNPGAGTLAGSNTANGVVPTDATTGVPIINAFGGSNTGYVTSISFGNTVACRLVLYDLLFKAGAYSFNSAVTLASQPSYSSRVVGGTNFNNTEIWLETVTNFTGNQTIVVTYTNQAGTAARTTGTIATGTAPIAGRMLQLPLQAGDTGVQKIESVTSTVSTVGTFNVLVMRRIYSNMRIRVANDGDTHDFMKTGFTQIFADSAFFLQVIADSTATGLPDVQIDVVNG